MIHFISRHQNHNCTSHSISLSSTEHRLSVRIYENLPEVQRRREEERRKAEYHAYRLNAQLFNKVQTPFVIHASVLQALHLDVPINKPHTLKLEDSCVLKQFVWLKPRMSLRLLAVSNCNVVWIESMTVFCVSFRESQTGSWAEDQRGNNQNEWLDIEINDVKLFFTLLMYLF